LGLETGLRGNFTMWQPSGGGEENVLQVRCSYSRTFELQFAAPGDRRWLAGVIASSISSRDLGDFFYMST